MEEKVAQELNVPKLIFTEDTSQPYDSGYEFYDRETRWSDIHRGPILRVVGTTTEMVLKYSKKPKTTDEFDLEKEPEENYDISETRKSIGEKKEFVCETPEPFSATPKSKQTRLIVLTNEGTTTIRYQWLRFPPSKAMKTMLANLRSYLNLSDEIGEREATPLQDNIAAGCGINLSKPRKGRNPTVSDTEYEHDSRFPSPSSSARSFSHSCDESRNVTTPINVDYEKARKIIGRKPEFLRDTAFDFHFREMPGMLLPGQTVEIPILFRPRKPGYCHESLYLLTHPRMTDENDKTFMVRLTGICMESEYTDDNPNDEDAGKERREPESVKRAVTKTMLELEGTDLIDSVLDQALYMKQKHNKTTLPKGKLTPECIFYAHNPQLYYHYGVAERALKTVRKVIRVLIPKQRMDMEQEHICSLSIKDLYSVLLNKSGKDDFFVSRFKTTKTERLLRRLRRCNRILTRPPIFAYANAGARKHMACQANMTAVMDSIFEKMDSIKETFNASPLYRIQRGQLEQNLRERKLKEYNRALRKERLLKYGSCYPDEEEEEEEEEETTRLNTEPGEFETTATHDTDFPVTTASPDGLANPPTGEEAKELGTNTLVVEKVGTATEEEHNTFPAAEMETDDEEPANVLEETQEAEENDTEVVPATKSQEEGESKENEAEEDPTGKKTKAKLRKESDGSELQVAKKKKLKKGTKSRIVKENSSKKGKSVKEKEKKLKTLSTKPEATKFPITDEDVPKAPEVGLEEEIENTGTPQSAPSSFEGETPLRPKTTEEMIYGDIDAQVTEMLRRCTEKKIRQARLIAFENMLGAGIERMLSVVDTMKNVNDYRSSKYYPGDTCCQPEF